MAMTLAERIMAEPRGATGIGGRVRRRRHRPGAGTRHLRGAGLDTLAEIGAGVFGPDRIAVVIDHLVPAPSPEAAEVHHRIRDHVARLGITAFYRCRRGHSPPAPAGTGPHPPGMPRRKHPTPTPPRTARRVAGGTGIGTSRRVTPWPPGGCGSGVPETIRYEFTGDLQPAVSWKDVTLHLGRSLRLGRSSVPVDGARRA